MRFLLSQPPLAKACTGRIFFAPVIIPRPEGRLGENPQTRSAKPLIGPGIFVIGPGKFEPRQMLVFGTAAPRGAGDRVDALLTKHQKELEKAMQQREHNGQENRRPAPTPAPVPDPSAGTGENLTGQALRGRAATNQPGLRMSAPAHTAFS